MNIKVGCSFVNKMYGYQQPGYGYGQGMPPMGQPPMGGYGYQQPMHGGYGAPPMMPQPGQYHPQPGYGAPMQGFGGFSPVSYCQRCGGTGYRWKKGRNKRCKCIKDQAKRMGRRRDFSSSSSD